MGRASSGGDSSITGRIRAVESADTVEAEAVGTVIGAVEDGRWGITSHWLACPLKPAAVLRALALKGTPIKKMINIQTCEFCVTLVRFLRRFVFRAF